MSSVRLLLCLICVTLLGCPPTDDDDSTAIDDDDTAVADDDDTVEDDDDSVVVDDDDSVVVDDDDTGPDPGDPPVASVDLLPDAPMPGDMLVASVQASDPEGADVVLEVRWEMDGAPIAALDDMLLVPASFTASGQQWTVTVIPNDGAQDGEPATDTVQIGNQPPVLFSVSIAPEGPTEGDVVTATPGGTLDPEGDAVTVSYAWWVGGVETAVTGDTLTSADFAKGDAIQVVATPNDGFSDGAPLASNTVVAVNTEPSGTDALVSPAAGAEDTVFTCTGDGYLDIDGDAEGWLYTWEINGFLEVPGSTVDGAWFDHGDWIVCQAWPHDGEAPGPMVTSTPILVANTAPIASGLTVTPTLPISSDTLVADVASATDLDGDGVLLLHEWTVDGTPAGSEAVLEPSAFARWSDVNLTVTPFDGTDEGTPLTAGPITIGNTPPEFTGVELTYDPATNSYLAAGLGWSDFDGDAEGYAFAWSNAAGPLSETGDTLAGSTLAIPDTVTVSLTANDGLDDGNTLASAVLDHAPAAGISPEVAAFGTVDEGCQINGTVTVASVGSVSLEVTGVTLTETLGNGYLSLGGLPAPPIAIAPGESLEVVIEYDGWETSESAADLVITTNDPDNASVTIPVLAAAEPGAPLVERFFWADQEVYTFQEPVLIPPTEILVDGDVETDFTFDAATNSLDLEDLSPSDGDEVLIEYVPAGTDCGSNLAPVVVASLATASPTACEPTLIDTTGSYDPDGDAFDLDYEFFGQPATSLLTGDDVSDDGVFVSVLADADGAYELDVWGVDEPGAAGAEVTVAFSGLAGAVGGVSPPVADAGPDVTGTATADCYYDNYGGLDCLACSGEPLRLDGSASADPDGGGLTFEWEPVIDTVELASHTRSSRPFLQIIDGLEPSWTTTTYATEVELTVTDCDGLQDTDMVTVTVVCTANILGTATIHQ